MQPQTQLMSRLSTNRPSIESEVEVLRSDGRQEQYYPRKLEKILWRRHGRSETNWT